MNLFIQQRFFEIDLCQINTTVKTAILDGLLNDIVNGNTIIFMGPQAVPWSKGLPRGTGVMPHALDPDAATRLWDLSEELTKSR